jgi:hypothetical protein
MIEVRFNAGQVRANTEDSLASFNDHMETLRHGCVASHLGCTTVDRSLSLDDVLSEFFFTRQATLNGGRS